MGHYRVIVVVLLSWVIIVFVVVVVVVLLSWVIIVYRSCSLKIYVLLMEDKMAAGALGHARNCG